MRYSIRGLFVGIAAIGAMLLAWLVVDDYMRQAYKRNGQEIERFEWIELTFKRNAGDQ